mgnify:CR=1 FL=1
MTIDEAIKHCLEVAEQNEQGLYDAIALGGQSPTQEEIANCEQCAADHRQLAEWLTDYKELKNSIGAVKLELLKEAQVELEKRSNMLHDAIAELEEAKRLLKSATNVLNMFIPCDEDYNCSECIRQRQSCDYDDSFKWRYLDEALKLIGGSEND